MVQALGVPVSLSVSMKSAGKLLEGFDIRNRQALPSFVPPFWVRPGPRAGLTDVAEMVRGTSGKSWESLA